MNSKCKCGHDKWDHELYEIAKDESLIFSGCKIDGCECSKFEEPDAYSEVNHE